MIDPEVLPAHLDRVLAADKRESDPEFQQKLSNVFEEARFELLLAGFGGERQKIEVVGIFGDLLRQIRLRRRKRPLEVCQGLALPPVELALDLKDENVAAPAVLDGGARVPQALVSFLDLLNQRDVLIPGQFCKRGLQNCFIGPGLGECLHLAEVARRESLHVRELAPEVLGEPFDDFGSPSVVPLPRQNLLADSPLKMTSS